MTKVFKRLTAGRPRRGTDLSHYGNQTFTYYDNFTTGWTDHYTRGTLTTDTDVVVEGTSSQKIVTNTPVATGEWCGVSKAVSMDLSDSAFRFYVRSPDWSKVGGVDIGISTNGNFVKSFNAGINGGISPPNDEWIELLLVRSRFTDNGTANWATANRIVVRAQGKVGQQATVYVSGFATLPMADEGVCSITFDDGFETDYTVAKPYLDGYSFKATSFIISDRINLAGRLTDAQIEELHDDGWDISSHTYSHPNLSTVAEVDLPAQFIPMKNYLVDHSYRGSDIFAYPQSVSNQTVRKVLANYHSYARTASRFGQPRTYIVPRMLMATDVSSVTTVQSIKNAIDAAKNDGEWLILIFHSVTDSGGTANVTVANFQEIIDYLNTSALPVRTISEVLALHPQRRQIHS